MTFSEQLIQLRKQKGLSQEALGNQINVSRQTISKWELGETAPDMDKLVALSHVFDVSLDTLALGKANRKITSQPTNAQVIGKVIFRIFLILLGLFALYILLVVLLMIRF